MRHLTAKESRLMFDALKASARVVATSYTPEQIEAIRAEARRKALDEVQAVVSEAVRGEGPLWATPVADPRGDREPDCSDVLDRLPAAIRNLQH